MPAFPSPLFFQPKAKARPGPGAKPTGLSLLTGLFSPEQLYLIVAAVLVLANARLFYGALKAQTEHVALWFSPQAFEELTLGIKDAPWSAPLDDVFIHFDFARSWARGHAFEWSDGNGYSSGGTSLLYPLVLGAGYWAGYRDLSLMHFAAIVACVSTFGALLGLRRAFSGLPALYALLLPPLFLSIGGLNWSLYSGMEVAFFLAIWAGSFVAWDNFVTLGSNATRQSALTLGAGLMLLVACRPEAAPLVAIFALTAVGPWLKERQWIKAFIAVCLISVPGALVLGAQMLANHLLTGSSAAAGGLAKLELYHPYLDSGQVFDSWLSFLRYQFERLSIHHFSALPGFGFVLWPMGLLSLAYRSTRRYGVLLWSTLLVWTMLVALNGQVRWQNERYAMPIVAWLLTSVALGLAGSFHAYHARLTRAPLPLFGLLILASLTVAHFALQAERFRDQVWFFARASRNILEQHVRTGDYLRRVISPHPQRVLVSDAGAIPYMSDLPAFDLIGLGGYAGLPIAQASRLGVGAAVELIEHLPGRDRPDVLALYPGWWGDFVLWFGRPVTTFSVRGNVICGGANMVLYRPDFRSLDHSGEPFIIQGDERLVDELDVADLLSEKAHRAELSRKAAGYVDMKMLADPRSPSDALWDAGRLLAPDVGLSFTLTGFHAEAAQALLVRLAPPGNVELVLTIEGQPERRISVEGKDRWQELRVPIVVRTREPRFTLRVEGGATHIHHLFAVERVSTAP
jgi:hypothetical protein